jgi:hypothetical protein
MTFKKGNSGDTYDTVSSVSSTDFLLVSKSSSNGRQVVKQVAVQGLPGETMLSNQGLTVSTYGDAFNIPQITVNEEGLITSINVTAGGITSVNSLTNVSAPSPTNGQGLVYTSGEWVNSSTVITSAILSVALNEYLTSASLGGLAFDSTVSAATLDSTGVSAGTYGTSAIIPQLIIDANGRVTSVVRATIAAGGGGVSFLTDVGDVSALSLNDGDILAWDSANSEWNPTTNQSGYTSAQVSTRVGEILTSGNYITSAQGSTRTQEILTSGAYYTSASVSARVQDILTSGGYLTSAVTTAQVSSIVEAYGYLTSAITTAQTSSLVEAYGYYVSASVSARVQDILTSNAYMTSASLGTLAFLDNVSSGNIIDNTVALTTQ